LLIAINSSTAGGFRVRRTNGREHLVVNMVPIVGDSVMNGILYPDAEVSNSFDQLDNLPAPNRHPEVNGEPVSAFHPMAINAHNIGAFVRNPKKRGKVVTNELWIDIEVANTSDGGKEIIKRIKKGKKLGVSTGLRLTRENRDGTQDGHEFNAVGRDFKFDHVALLLNEKAAGEEFGTEVTHNNESVAMANLDKADVEEALNHITSSGVFEKLRLKLRAHLFLPDDKRLDVEDVILDESAAVYVVDGKTFTQEFTLSESGVIELLGVATEVERQVIYEPRPMAGIGSQTQNHQSGEQAMTSFSEAKQLVEDAGHKVVNAAEYEAAQNSADKLSEVEKPLAEYTENRDSFKEYTENKAGYDAYKAEQAERVETLRKEIAENSEDFNSDDLANMPEAMLMKISNSLKGQKKSADNSARPGGLSINSGKEPVFGAWTEAYAEDK